MPRVSPPKASSFIHATAFIFVVLLAAFSPLFHRQQNADSLLPVIIAYENWSPFYWEQNRFGLPLAGIAAIAGSLRGIYYAYNTLLLGCALGALWLTLKFYSGKAWLWIPGALLLLCIFPPKFFFEFYFQPYGASIFFSMLALFILSRCRGIPSILFSLVSFFLGFWINLGIVPFCSVLVAGAATYQDPPVKKINGHVLTIYSSFFLAALAAWVLAAQYPGSDSFLRIHPLTEWPGELLNFFKGSLRALPQYYSFFILFTPPVILLPLRCWQGRNSGSTIIADRILLLLFAGWLNFFIFGISGWPAQNDYAWRYALPAYFVSLVCLLHICGEVCGLIAHKIEKILLSSGLPADTFTPAKKLSIFFLILLIALFFYVRLGPPSLEQIETTLKERHGTFEREIFLNKCTHFAGTYWKVWPAVFFHNFHKPPQKTLGIAHRARGQSEKLKNSLDHSGKVICSPHADPEALPQLSAWGLGSAQARQQLATIDVLE